MTASYDAACTADTADDGSEIGQCSDDPAIAELFADAARRRAATHLHPSCLTIESHGRSYELGSFLTEELKAGIGR